MRPSALLQLTRPATHVVAEAIAAGRAAAYYPTGLSDRISDRLCSPRRSPTSPRRLPVLLLHGIWHNQSWAVRLERSLAEQGYVCWSVNYRTIGRNLDDAAAQVAQYVRLLAERHGVDQVHVVAHSLGGLVLRTAAVRHGIGSMLAAAVTIGTPHTGSPLALRSARVLPGIGALVAQIGTGSAFLRQLDTETESAGTTQWTAIYSTADEIVPGRRGRLDHPKLTAHNVKVTGVGHLGLMFHHAVIRSALTALTAADHLRATPESVVGA